MTHEEIYGLGVNGKYREVLNDLCIMLIAQRVPNIFARC